MLPVNQQQSEGKSISFKNRSKSPTANDLKISRKTRANNKKQANNKVNYTSIEKVPLTNTLNSPKKAAIRVGSNFQVLSLPEAKGRVEVSNSPPRDECLWKMHQMIKDEQLSNYCIDAYTNFGIEPDRALFILFKSNYDFEKGSSNLKSRHIFNHSFSHDDAYAFRNAFMYFGKNFARVRQILPHKTIGSLVEHYYKSKKNQNYKGDYKSYLDIAATRSSSPSDDDTDGSEFYKPFCELCKEVVTKIYLTNGLEVCKTCKLGTNQHQIFPQSSEDNHHNQKNCVSKCPPNMHQICNEFVEMAKYVNQGEENSIFNNKEEEEIEQIIIIKRSKTVCEAKIDDMKKSEKLLKASTKRIMQDVQKQKTLEGCQKYSFVDALQFLSKTENSFNLHKQNNVNFKWSQWEKDAVFNALIRFEADENAVASIIPTKTPKMIKQFYLEFKQTIDEEINKRLIECENFNFFNQNGGEGCSNNYNNFIRGKSQNNNEPEVIELD